MEIVENSENDDNKESIEELLLEVGEISRDFASVSVNFERMNDSFLKIIDLQRDLINSIDQNTKLNLQAVNPNPQMLEVMSKTNESLELFNAKIQDLNLTLEKVKSEKWIIEDN